MLQRMVRAWQARTMVSRLGLSASVAAAKAIQAAMRGRMARVRAKARRRHQNQQARRKSVVPVGATHITVRYTEFGGGGYVEQKGAGELADDTAAAPPTPHASRGARNMRRSVSKPSDVGSERVGAEAAAAGSGLKRSVSRPQMGVKTGGGIAPMA